MNDLDTATAWLQITSGRGPAECERVVERVMQTIVAAAKEKKLKASVLETTPGVKPKTFASVLLQVTGSGLDGFINEWSGTVQWMAQSPFRPHHKRKNWFVGIQSLTPPATESWPMNDLKFEAMRATGPGGQNVNKVSTAVRLTHLPTGIAVTAREERSQHANRKLALARLKNLLDARTSSNQDEFQQTRWDQHNELERGNPVKVIRETLD
jgi:peptide chain release factor